MPDLYLGVLCSDCRTSHDLYNTDRNPHARGCSYSYTCPASGRAVAIRISFPDAVSTAVPRGAVPLIWVADGRRLGRPAQ
jgi:hypothetical protein